ncbi:MAG TPA: alpha/beta hydrolase [Solirubrobacteraceae bacterium]|nr:alpha/beta hydrolase [Solirubrobacteraceae bacterium]
MSMTSENAHQWRSELLGELGEIDSPAGRLEYFQRGDGPVIVFAHGWLANANLWRNVIDQLADRFTCIALDLPLGAHRTPMDHDADLTPAGCGALISCTLAALGLVDVTLVGNDSGGAYSQIAVADNPHRVSRLVLNSCETPHSEFPPAPFDGLPAIAKDPHALGQLFEALRNREIRMTPPAFGLLIKHPIDNVVSDSYALPCVSNPAILHDTSKVMSTASSGPVHEAGRRLIADFRQPVLLAWSPEDKVFAPADAKRYTDELSDGRLVLIDDAYSFTPEDQPERLSEQIAAFVHGRTSIKQP